MKKIGFVAGLMALGGASLFGTATTGYVFLDAISGTQNTLVSGSSTYYVSPFNGAMGTNGTSELGTGNAVVKLFCDDFADHATAGTDWSVTITNVANDALTATRYDTAVGTTGLYPTGTNLYQELAWLFTQSIAPNVTADNQDTIQEAAWKLTGAAGTTPNVSYTSTGTKSLDTWISLAASAVTGGGVTGYLTPDYSKWYVVTDRATTGTTTGHVGTGGNQEFLAYYNTTSGNPVKATPEPATFVLAGAALLAFGLSRRRKTVQQ